MTSVVLAERLLAACAVVAAVLVSMRVALARAPQLVRGRFGARRERRLAVLESAFLPGGASLHVVRAGRRRLVIGRASTTLVALGELDEGEESREARAGNGPVAEET